MKPKHALFAFALLLLAAACARHIQGQGSTYAPTAEETAWIKERLLTIKKELPEFDRIDDNLQWKLMDCRAPYDDPYPVAYKDTIFDKDSLYRLYVKAKLEYSRAGSIAQPENQVIVKATYEPVPLETAQPQSDKQAALGADGKWYREGAPSDLYVMFRTDRKGIQTDAGWVYGIVSMQEDRVIAQGLLGNCMGCHRENAPDRLFGIREE